MSCILRIYGDNLDLEKLLEHSSLIVDSFWKKGECRSGSTAYLKINESSGIRIVVSKAEFSELTKQINDAILFFTQFKSDITRITSFKNVEGAVLDFGSEIHPPGFSSFSFPPELMLLVGEANVSLCISVYPTDDES